MSLATQLNAVVTGFELHAPQNVQDDINASKSECAETFDWASAIKAGSILPTFTLLDAHGIEATSASLLAKGPVLITFYRGSWCPFCNLALRDLQKHLSAFAAKGVMLVAISPQLPDQSLSTAEKADLKFTVLSDVGNQFARKLGIVWKQPDTLRSHFDAFGHDLQAVNGDDSFEVPIPTTLLVDRGAIVRNVFIETDYTKRLDSEVALGWVDALRAI